MAEDRLKENQFDKQGVNPFNAPIPGESLTTAPDSKKHGKDHLNLQMKMTVWKTFI